MDRTDARTAVPELAPAGGRLVEIGVWKGDFSAEILSRAPREFRHPPSPW
jgi:hypothetical protein